MKTPYVRQIKILDFIIFLFFHARFCFVSFKFIKIVKTNRTFGESRGLVVKGEDWQLSGCGFEPLRSILDGVSEASYCIGKEK